jgi:hypothetical protein
VRCSLLVGLVAGLSLFPLPARAADWPDDDSKVLPCRPTVSCIADFAPPGTFELETGALYRHVESPGPEWSFPFLVKFTATKWLQIQASGNGFTTTARAPSTAQFFDNVSLGPKFHLADADSNGLAPSLALSAALSIPTFSGQEGYSSAYDAVAVAYVSKDIGPIHVDWNAGMQALQIDHTTTPQEFVTLALSASLPPPFGIMAETYYFSDSAPIATRDGGFLFALSHSPRPWLTFDVGADVGYFPSVRTFSSFFGMTIVPVVLWK